MSNIDIGHMFYFKLIYMNISKKEKNSTYCTFWFIDISLYSILPKIYFLELLLQESQLPSNEEVHLL